MELQLLLGLLIIFSCVSFTFKLLGFGFRIFFGLLIGAFTLLSYLMVGVLSLAFPFIAVIILFILFRKD